MSCQIVCVETGFDGIRRRVVAGYDDCNEHAAAFFVKAAAENHRLRLPDPDRYVTLRSSRPAADGLRSRSVVTLYALEGRDRLTMPLARYFVRWVDARGRTQLPLLSKESR